jgi:branched-chain amino acid transport system substrate-binding protein
MRRQKLVGLLALLLVVGLIAAACGDDDAATTTAAPTTSDGGGASTTAATGEPIVLGDLAYFTGAFAANGPNLAAEAEFPVLEVINLDPPLGRPIEIIHEDIGTVGEAQAARKLVDQDQVDILLSPAHEYFTYRDWMLEVIAEEDRPLMPTVHGGVINVNIGGTAEEPIFRAQGLDEAMGVTDIVYAESVGIESVAMIATETAGFQLMANAAERAAGVVGIEVLDRVDAAESQASYRSEVERAGSVGADALIIMAPPATSGTIVKNVAEAGISTIILLESGSGELEFYDTATPAAIATQEAVLFPGFAHQENEAWEFFQPLWDGNPEYADRNPASAFFPYTTYDLLIVTALAIEEGGSPRASDWAPAMFRVTDAPGEVCYTYATCIDLIRAGQDIDYEGVTGPATFSEHGVNAVTNAMFQWDGDTGEFVQVALVDADRHLEILAQVAAPHEG